MFRPSGGGIVSEIFVASQALVFGLLDKLILQIGGAAKHACLGETHIHGRFHSSFGPPHFRANDYMFLSRTKNLYVKIRGTTELICQITGSGRLGQYGKRK